jgi:hypothetical protein
LVIVVLLVASPRRIRVYGAKKWIDAPLLASKRVKKCALHPAFFAALELKDSNLFPGLKSAY